MTDKTSCKLCATDMLTYSGEWCDSCLQQAASDAKAAGFKPYEFYASLPVSMQQHVRTLMKEHGIPLWVIENKGVPPSDVRETLRSLGVEMMDDKDAKTQA